MTDPVNRADLSADLARLLTADVLTSSQQTAGTRIAARLATDVSILLAGPQEAAKEYLHDVLVTLDLPQTSPRVVPWGTPPPLGQADVCLWCTAEFTDDEVRQWRGAPDRLKDHSFLVAFSDFAPTAQPSDAVHNSRLENIAAEEFYRFAHVTFGNKATALQPTAVKALVEDVTELVRMGQAADTDNALMFLTTHRSKLPQATRASTPAAQQSAPMAPPCASPTTAVYQKALGTMRSHLTELEPFMTAQDTDEFQEILNICENTSAAVADVLADSDVQEPEFRSVKDEVLSAADAILLMSSEGGAAPALSAVTTVLQLRREMELRIAC